jgi:predicted Rossmann fold flavoprotein
MADIKDFVVIGGGAAGVFGAIQKKIADPSSSVILLEKSAVLLSKVRVSGGGRCNVTHACFDPALLCQNYPRGSKELRAPFHRFQPRDTIAWFESRGVLLKTEADGRMFPVTDNSQTIIDCLLNEANLLKVEIRLRQKILKIVKQEGYFAIEIEKQQPLWAKKILLATGSSPEGYRWAEELGHTIQPPVPSLFTFNVPASPLTALSGMTLPEISLTIVGTSLRQKGALLMTHFGFSGPAVLKLSAWGARYFHEKNYHLDLQIDWVPSLSENEIFEKLMRLKQQAPQKNFLSENLFALPKNLWKHFLGGNASKKIHDISLKEMRSLAKILHKDVYHIEGKTTNKEEFVTCGGVTLKEIDFKTMESKVCPHLFFAGEILDIDAVTGGFNFQNAWTTAFLAGSSLFRHTES